MEVEAKFSLPDRDTFERLRTLDQLAGYDLADSRAKNIRDTYLDTHDRRIMSSGHMCRRREQNGNIIITLKQLKAIEGPVHRREEMEIALPVYKPPIEWPDSVLRTRVLELIDDAPLNPLFGLRQSRLVRPILQNGRLVAELSLDEVHMASSGNERDYVELEVELKEEGTEQDLDALVAHLEAEWGLVAQPRSKFERALAFFGEEPGPPPP